MKDSNTDPLYEGLIAVIGLFVCATFLGALVVVGLASNRRLRPIKSSTSYASFVLFIVSFALFYTVKVLHPHGIKSLFFVLPGIWAFGAALALITFPVWNNLLPTGPITAEMTNHDSTSPLREQRDREGAFIGHSLLSSKPLIISEHERTMHTLVSGSTGSGKTTVLKSLFIDAIEKNQPILIIDPKGNYKTIEEFRSFARAGGKDDAKFKLFSIINSKESATYNPLARGTSIQIRDRLMGALEWSEPFYKHQASAWLGLAIDLLRGLGFEISIGHLHRLLTDPKEFEPLEDQCTRISDLKISKELCSRLRALAKYDKKNLDGLAAQLRDLDNLEFGSVFDTCNERPSIELSQILRNSEIAYFQLNTMAYEGAAKAIGRLILQDLKALASQIHGGQETGNAQFFPIFVDEFGSFAFEGFVDFLKMARDVKFANHLFFQSLADLDAVSEQFKSQVQQNCLTKIIMRTDDPKEVDFWAGVAGTQDAIESSYQLDTVFGFKVKTGAGNMRITKQMRIEHDVFKRLKVGQAILVQKSPAREDLLQLWNPTFTGNL